jgi:3-dehydroquinate dehydratase
MQSQLTFDGVGGSAVSVSISDVHKHISGDYIEVHIANVSGTDSITVTDLNVLVTQLG